MTARTAIDPHGTLIAPTSLKIQRRLPGTIERCWSYLTDSELRRQWLAAGDMEMRVGAPFELVWRNDELSGSPGDRPEGFPQEHRLQSTIVDLDPPRRLVFTWRDGEVTFELEPEEGEVLLTVTHRRVSDRANVVSVSAGWHAHLDILVARLGDQALPPRFWQTWSRLKDVYEARIPA